MPTDTAPKGDIVGINTAIASRSGGNNGIAFAIPINMAKGTGRYVFIRAPAQK